MVGEMEAKEKPKPSPDYLMQLMNDKKLMSSLPNFCGIFNHLERLLDEGTRPARPVPPRAGPLAAAGAAPGLLCSALPVRPKQRGSAGSPRPGRCLRRGSRLLALPPLRFYDRYYFIFPFLPSSGAGGVGGGGGSEARS